MTIHHYYQGGDLTRTRIDCDTEDCNSQIIVAPGMDVDTVMQLRLWTKKFGCTFCKDCSDRVP